MINNLTTGWDKLTLVKLAIYLSLSTLITWWFIKTAPFYVSDTQMLLSCTIAGGKWAIQLVAGFLIFDTRRWLFVKEAAFVCFIGSIILLPYCLGLNSLGSATPQHVFIGYLALSVITMMMMYFRMVNSNRFSIKWFILWLSLLAIAVTLQLTIVF